MITMLGVVLAGGKGLRMLPLTKDRPKAMVEIRGKPLLEWVLLELKKAGIRKVIIVVGYKKEKIVEHFGKRFNGLSIEYVVQKKPFGTGHALAQAKKAVEKLSAKQFIVCYADVIANHKDVAKLINARRQYVMGLRYEAEPERFGVVCVKNRRVVSLTEKPKKVKKPALVNAGVYKFHREIFEILEKLRPSKRNELELTDALKKLIRKGKLGYVIMGNVLDIGTLADLEAAQQYRT